VNSFTYLGIVFTTGGSFSLTYDALSGQALKAIYKLKSNLVKYPDISVNHRLDLFNKLIEPILSYGCEVWGLNNSVQIERIHIRYCKQVLGVRLQTQNNFVYGELGRVPLINKRIICVLKYWFKILQSDDVKYIKIVYDMLLHDHDIYPEKKSWVKSLRDVLDSLGFSDVWFFQGVGDIKIFLSVAKQRISDMFLQTWSSEMENTTRGRIYRLFSSFQFQPYLNLVNVLKFRMA